MTKALSERTGVLRKASIWRLAVVFAIGLFALPAVVFADSLGQVSGPGNAVDAVLVGTNLSNGEATYHATFEVPVSYNGSSHVSNPDLITLNAVADQNGESLPPGVQWSGNTWLVESTWAKGSTHWYTVVAEFKQPAGAPSTSYHFKFVANHPEKVNGTAQTHVNVPATAPFDSQPPTWNAGASDAVIVEATGPGGAAVTYTVPTAIDNLDPNPTVVCDVPQGTTFTIGTHVDAITCTATDDAGNTATLKITVIVQDTTPPAVGIAVTTATAGLNGWYKAAKVTFTASDAVGTLNCTLTSGYTLGVESGFLADGTHNLSISCSDTAGNVGTASLTVKVDGTAPTASANPSPPANSNGWNNTDVTVSFSGTDNAGGSGVASCTTPILISTEGAGQSASGTCTDAAGNVSAPATATVNIDKTKPTASASRSPLANVNGWNNTNVTVHFTGTDNVGGSDIDFCTADIVKSTDGAGQSASGTCTDKAGNVSDPATITGINIDKTKPTASALKTPAANGFGWNNTDVTVSFSGTDGSGSGIDTCSDSVPVTVETSGLVVSGTCTDKAGNVSDPASVTVKIDKTKPVATATASPTPNLAGWNNTNVTVHFTGTDDRSGIDTCVPDVVISTEGMGLSASGTCTDKAGNVSDAAEVTGIKIDKTAPVVTYVDNGTHNGANPWYTGGTINFSVDDVVNTTCVGVKDVTLVNGANQVLTYTCTDQAGNVGSASLTVNVDGSKPNATATPTPPANSNGWNNTNVIVTFSGTDVGPSGIASCTAPVTLSTEGAGQSASGTCTDNAGNVSDTATALNINIDKTKPTATASRTPATGNANGWNNTNVTVHFTGDDGTGSGIDFCTADIVKSSDGANQSASGTCTDKAGNVSDPATITGINIDKTKPVATATASPLPNANGWNNTDVTVTFTGTDAGGSGLDTCTTPVTLTAEAAGQVASGTCTDKAGNVSDPATKTVNIDKTAPSFTATVGGTLGNNGWWKSASVTYTAVDPLSGLAAPCVASQVVNLPNGANQSGSKACSDLAGNTSVANWGPVNVDGLPPTITIGAITQQGEMPTCTAVDQEGLSGLAGTVVLSSSYTSTTSGIAYTVTCSASDNAGNSSSAVSNTITVAANLVCNVWEQPLPSPITIFTAGSTVPLKLQCKVNGKPVNVSGSIFAATDGMKVSNGSVAISGTLALTSSTNWNWNTTKTQGVSNTYKATAKFLDGTTLTSPEFGISKAK